MRAEQLIGQVLHDTHRIVRKVGEGSTGAVYEARHVRLSDELRFAVKVLHEQRGTDPKYYARFRREAETISRIHHPNIVEIVDFYRIDDGRPCIVMEYLDGRDLADVLRGGRMDPAPLAAVVEQVAGALQTVHDLGIVHRDIKPGNVFLTPEPDGGVRTKVLDFGISKVKGAAAVLTQPKVVLGTPGYMAPEQINGQTELVGRRTDIFALGVICHEALSGQRPFRGLDYKAVFFQICEREPPPISAIRPDLPPALDRVVARAMAKDPADRYAQAVDFACELLDVVGEDAGGVSWAAVVRSASGGSTGDDATEDYLPEGEHDPARAPTVNAGPMTAPPADPGFAPETTAPPAAGWSTSDPVEAGSAVTGPLSPVPSSSVRLPPPRVEGVFGRGFWWALGLVAVLLSGALALALSRPRGPTMTRSIPVPVVEPSPGGEGTALTAAGAQGAIPRHPTPDPDPAPSAPDRGVSTPRSDGAATAVDPVRVGPSSTRRRPPRRRRPPPTRGPKPPVLEDDLE